MTTAVLGIDAGGTFTDFVLCRFSDAGPELTVHKVLSTPDNPARAILQGIRDLGLMAVARQGGLRIVHGSTVATNALLEGRLARTALVTNRGFADLLTIGRQTRPTLFELEFPPTTPPVPAALCLETGGRIGSDGTVLEPLTDADLADLLYRLKAANPQAIAINLLFSFLDDSAERRIESAIAAWDATRVVSRSSAVLREAREYERGIATWLNAALGPAVAGYLRNLAAELPAVSLQIMQSSGDTLPAGHAADHAVHLLLSGPAGGLQGLRYLGHLMGETRLLSFDMGGTSTDVALLDGAPQLTTEATVAGYPIGVPMVDMHTIGAGGGSVADLDAGGMLTVGPHSAGADPGPACYGRGGLRATVTDANLVLGYLPATTALAGGLPLDRGAACAAVGALADRAGLSMEAMAAGILQVANAHMAAALRLISVQRGHDPRRYTLACFGGAGGLHVCALAESLGMTRALMPVHAGVLSALGMLAAVPGRGFSRTVNLPLTPTLSPVVDGLLSELTETARETLAAEGGSIASLRAAATVDLCYAGQSSTLSLPWTDAATAIAAFHEAHARRYGFSQRGPVQLVTLRLRLSQSDKLPALRDMATVTGGKVRPAVEVYGLDTPVPVLSRAELPVATPWHGPMIVVDTAATLFVAPGWTVSRDDLGNLLLCHEEVPGRLSK